jgi:hypothetical protein
VELSEEKHREFLEGVILEEEDEASSYDDLSAASS